VKNEIKYTLLSDGSSDKMLMPVITWALRQNLGNETLIQAEWAQIPRKLSLSERISFALLNFPCNILFVHRDSEKKEKEVFEMRKLEIENAWTMAAKNNEKIVPVVPIRMTEAWLLIDEVSIRKASGNPNGAFTINLPQITNLETLPDSKSILEQLVRDASGLKGRNLKKFNVKQAKHLVSENISDFSPLKGLMAFTSFEKDLRTILSKL
jgi:hypothetical protein